MKKITYKPGIEIYASDTKNNYYQCYWFGDKLWYKGYRNNIGYQENYEWRDKGIKYIL